MRYIVCRMAPHVAKQKTITGSPFQLITIFNFYKFLPTIIYLSKIAIRKFADVYLHISIMSGFTTPDYDMSEWYRQALKDKRCEDLLQLEHMATKGLYDIDYFKRFLAGLRNIFGGTVRSYESLIDRARREAVLRMKEMAGDASVIVNVRIETSNIGMKSGKKVLIGGICGTKNEQNI